MQEILDFLSELSLHNDREWFNAHKEQYLRCKATFDQFCAHYIERLIEIDSELMGNTPANTIWRIYRDVRFSGDKRPYKEWFGIFPAAMQPGLPKTAGRKSDRGGYYFHIQPGQCMFAAGIWCPNRDLLAALRREIEANYDEVESIMAAPEWQRYFTDFDTDQMLRKVPAGFDPDFVHADWLKRKAYTFTHRFTDEEICRPDFLDLLVDVARAAQPLNAFLNYTFVEYGEFPDKR